MVDFSNSRQWIGLSGAIPDRDELCEHEWGEGGTRIVVSRLASRILEAGAGIVYGSHPTFVPLVEEIVSTYEETLSGATPVQMFVARRFIPSDEEEAAFRASHERFARIIITGQKDLERQPALTDMRRRMIGECHALVCIGGKHHHTTGHRPGVGEEVELAMERGLPVYLIGAGGGYVLSLFKEEFRGNTDRLNNGLSSEENELLATALDPWQSVSLVMKGLQERRLVARAKTNWEKDFFAPAPMTRLSEESSMERIEYLVVIQKVIARLAGNASTVKGWSVTLVSAILAFAASKDATSATALFGVAGMVPVIFFWYLDAYYLNLERKYRRLYEAVLAESKLPTGERQIEPFSMDLRHVKGEVEPWWKTAVQRPAVSVFHGALVATIWIVIALLLLI